MKNILIFISPTKSFDNPIVGLTNDAGLSVKVQIENSLRMGWQKKDFMLFTNFDYEYGDIKATVLDDVAFFERKPQASKINAIIKLFENGIIKSGEIYWFHDMDAFQLCSKPELEIDLGTCDMALTDYGRNDRWSTGVIYFKKSAKDIFYNIRDLMYKKNIDEERALTILTRTDEKIDKRIKKLNKSYNFTPRNLRTMYALAEKPLRVAHFHPTGVVWRGSTLRSFDFYKGENSLHIPLITERLIKIFHYHKIR